MAGRGRPTKYRSNFVQKAKEYIESGYIEQGDVVPSVVGLAKYLGVLSRALYDWGKKYPAFSQMLDSTVEEQHRLLLANGLAGTYNSNIVKLMLSKHGYSERWQGEISGRDGGPIKVDPPTRVEVVLVGPGKNTEN